jgi:hypothetical protein
MHQALARRGRLRRRVGGLARLLGGQDVGAAPERQPGLPEESPQARRTT